MDFIVIGSTSIVNKSLVACVMSADDEGADVIVENAKQCGLYIDTCKRRQMRSVLILSNGQLISSCLALETIAARLNSSNKPS